MVDIHGARFLEKVIDGADNTGAERGITAKDGAAGGSLRSRLAVGVEAVIDIAGCGVGIVLHDGALWKHFVKRFVDLAKSISPPPDLFTGLQEIRSLLAVV